MIDLSIKGCLQGSIKKKSNFEIPRKLNTAEK